MKTLALELSSGRGSIAFVEDEESGFAMDFANDRKHSGVFFQTLERCLQECGSPERIVVGLGPGSYAGTRIAIATATGLQAATGALLLGLPSLCALPFDGAEYGVIGDARRQSFFYGRVRDRRCVEGPGLIMEAQLVEWLSGVTFPVFSAEALERFASLPIMYPSATVLAKLTSGDSESLLSLEPIYLRDPYITRPRPVKV